MKEEKRRRREVERVERIIHNNNGSIPMATTSDLDRKTQLYYQICAIKNDIIDEPAKTASIKNLKKFIACRKSSFKRAWDELDIKRKFPNLDE